MDANVMSSPCKECNEEEEGQLHAAVAHLRQHLAERDSHIISLEDECYKSSLRTKDLEEQLTTWREKYERLYDSHKRVQKLNQVLEDKLLQMVDKMKSEKSQLTKDIATLSVRLAESKHNYSMLQKENERYKNDMNLAIQLLQCKPDNFVSQRLDNLPIDTQARVSQYVMSKTTKSVSSTHSKNGNEHDTFDASEYEFNISASLMTKILEDSIQDTVTKHCDTCTCSKSQSKPFCYNESYYSIATQTALSGEMKNSFCLNCNADVKSNHSNLSMRSMSPHGLKLVNEKSMIGLTGPLYIIPQPAAEPVKQIIQEIDAEKQVKPNNVIDEGIEEIVHLDGNVLIDAVPNIKEDLKHYRKTNGMNMEPAVHHKLCDRTRTSISSKKSSAGTEDLLVKDPIIKEIKPKNENMFSDSISVRKNSHSSTGAISRTSSLAKSTVSTHKSNTQVGPGPRFCHLRMQAGSKNILLDNAQPDVPPILYRRQSKCNENSIFKDLNDGMDNFLDLVKADNETNLDVKKDNVVVDTTLIDVQIDNNTKEPNATVKNSTINPVLLNVSSSPLQPLKTHNFSNCSENNNNQSQSLGSQHNTSEIENLLSDFQVDELNSQNNNVQPNGLTIVHDTCTNDNDIKIFNFDRYEQTKLASQYVRPLRKIEMAQFHSIENTKISKDFPPQGEVPKLTKKEDIVSKPSLPPVVNVYPNLTQTQLKVNETTKVFTNEKSTSSLSSDDSAALLQKQQLLRVAEWVEQNLEQHNNLDDPSEDDVSFNRALRRDSKLSRLTETLNEIALNMPHPVSKYSKSFNRSNLAWLQNNVAHDKNAPQVFSNAKVSKVIKETIFPVECGEASITESKDNPINVEEATDFDIGKELKQASEANGKEITPEELARMEYNVKKFLLSGPNWANPESVGRSRRTSSRTETDV